VWQRLFFKVFFAMKCIKITFFFEKKSFMTSAYQNYLKTPKNINLKQIKKIFFSKTLLKHKNTQTLISNLHIIGLTRRVGFITIVAPAHEKY
jgi:hypothetical protein